MQHRSLTSNDASLSYGALLGTTTWGMAWLVRSQSVVGLLLALLLARRARGAWYGLALAIAALALVGITAGTSLSGHAASVVPRIPAVLTDMVHLLSVGSWIGTLGLLLIVALPLLRSDASTALIAVRAFSRVAMVAVALMLLTGVLSASNHLASLPSSSSCSRSVRAISCARAMMESPPLNAFRRSAHSDASS